MVNEDEMGGNGQANLHYRNPGNCELWVLEKCEKNRYFFSTKGDLPKSSRDVTIHFKNGTSKVVTIEDYLTIPPPRTSHGDVVLERLKIDKSSVEAVDFWNGKFHSNFTFDDERRS